MKSMQNYVCAALLVACGFVLGTNYAAKNDEYGTNVRHTDPVALHATESLDSGKSVAGSAMPKMPRQLYTPKRRVAGKPLKATKPMPKIKNWRYRKMKELGLVPSYDIKGTQCFMYADAPPGTADGEEIDEKDIVWKIATFNKIGMVVSVKPATEANIPEDDCGVGDLMTDDMWKAIRSYEWGPI